MTINSHAVEKYLSELNSRELLLKLTWEEWLAITEPYANGELLERRCNRALPP